MYISYYLKYSIHLYSYLLLLYFKYFTGHIKPNSCMINFIKGKFIFLLLISVDTE